MIKYINFNKFNCKCECCRGRVGKEYLRGRPNSTRF